MSLLGGGPTGGGGMATGGNLAGGTGGVLASGGNWVTGGSAAGGSTPTGGTAGVGGSSGSGGDTLVGGAPPTGTVHAVDATQVRLLSGSPFYDRQELHRQGYLASLDPDRLLYDYRRLANLPQAGGVTGGYPGWDTGFIRGHMTGHYLSAASRMAVATDDATFETRVEYIVDALAQCQTALNQGGYLAAFPSTVFDWLEGNGADGGGIVVPYYTVQKIMSGLLDAYHYLGNQQALEVVTRMADYFQGRLAALGDDVIERIFRTDGNGNPQNEFGAMSDALAELSEVTGRADYLDLAQVFNRSWFVVPLASGEDRLEGLHANTHIAQALGVAHTANLRGDPSSLQASEHFWELLADDHSFVTGGNSFHEWLDRPGVEAGPSIDGGTALPDTTGESCNTHNMLKLTSVLFARSPRAEYADYYERALHNHVLATMAPDTGHMTYFTPLRGHFRTYIDGTYCCTGTGIENAPRYNEGIYFADAESLFVNLYIPSEVTWEETGLEFRQEGSGIPGEPVQFTVAAGSPTTATLYFRIPHWSGAPVVTVNGTPLDQSAPPSSYVSLTREWSVGDAVALTLPAALRLEFAKDVSSMVAVFYGPLLLAGELGSDDMPADFADKDAYLGRPPVPVPDIVASAAEPSVWLEASATEPLTFQARDAGPATGITFRPLYEVHHQRYAVYWNLQASN